MIAKPNALVTTDIDGRLMPGSVAIVRDTDGIEVAFNEVPAEVDGDTDWWVRIDAALRQVGWSTVGVGHIPGPGVAEFTAVEATDVVWRRRTKCKYQLEPGDRILRGDGIETVTHVGECIDDHDAMTWVSTDVDPGGRTYYSSDLVTVLVAGEVR